MSYLSRQRVRRWWIVPFLIGAVTLLLGSWLQGWSPSITGRDLNQHRANVPAAIPNDNLTISQTFVPSRDGLHEIELIVYQVGKPGEGELTLDLLDEGGNLIGSQVLGSAELTLNQIITFQFPHQKNSANTLYTLRISGRDNTTTTFWGFNLEAISRGQLATSDPSARTAAQDLRIVTRYQLTAPLMLRHIRVLFAESLLPISVLLWSVFVMGWLVRYGLGKQLVTGDLPTDIALTFALGLCVWPLLWLWLTTLGGRWGRTSLITFIVIATLMTVIVKLTHNKTITDKLLKAFTRPTRHQQKNEEARTDNHPSSFILHPSSLPSNATITARHKIVWQHIVLAILLFVGYLLRLLAIRDLAFPAWVDASRHGLITVVMRDSGQFLQNYGGYLPIDHAPLYHFGYHTLTATLALLTNAELPHLLLTTGQLLNASVPLAVYAAAYLLTRERTVGLFAAFLIAFPSFFPAYYVSWGRYTQLTGMIVLALLLGWSYWLEGDRECETTWEWVNEILLIGLLGAGLFLIHFRVFLVFLPFGFVIWLLHLRRENWWKLPLSGVVVLGLVLPRFLQMAQYVSPERVGGASDGYNDFPVSYIKIGWERWFLIAAFCIVIIAVLQFTQKVRWRNRLIIVVMLVVVLVGEWLGSIPAAFEVTYLRTGVVGGLLVLSLWPSAENWVALPIAWIIIEPFFASRNDKMILAGLLLVTIWIIQLRDIDKIKRIPLLLAGAVGLLFILLSGQRLGLPESWVLNMNSTYITLFLPLAIVLGYGLFMVGERAAHSQWIVQIVAYTVMGAGVMLLTLYGGRQQIEIMNQATVLAERADMVGVEWVAEHLPANAKIAVSSWKWLGVSWAAQDGGAWLLPMTGKMTTTPPADYIYESQLEKEVRLFNEAAQEIEDWSAESALEFLQNEQVTHIYVGARGGFFLPDKLIQHSEIQLLFAQDGVFIFELTP